jgi:uncharacterized protein (TIRG00374 family)
MRLPTSRGKRRIPLWVRIALTVVVLAASIWFVVLPQLGDAKLALESMRHPPLLLLIAAALFEGGSNAAYSALTVAIIGTDRLSYFTALRIDAADLGVNHVVPGGGATAAAIRFRLFVQSGLRSSEALSAAAVEITLSNLLLGILFGIGLAASLSIFSSSNYYLIAVVVVLFLLLAALVAGWMLVQRTAWCLQLARWAGRRVRRIGPERAQSVVQSIAERVRTLVRHPRNLAVALGLAGVNWILDAASLWVMFAAFGQVLPVGTVLAVYCLGSILAMLPFTPGGLGLVEGVMVPAFVVLGVPAGTAVLAVIGWRVLEYWLPIPISGVAYLSLRFSRARRRKLVPAS